MHVSELYDLEAALFVEGKFLCLQQPTDKKSQAGNENHFFHEHECLIGYYSGDLLPLKERYTSRMAVINMIRRAV